MSTETHCKVQKLKAELEINEKEIELLEIEGNILSKELRELEWPFMEWADLEKYLKENLHDDYQLNPEVKSWSGHHWTYCRILTEGEHAGEMQVGPYYNHDNFPRGEKLRVHYQFKRYR